MFNKKMVLMATMVVSSALIAGCSGGNSESGSKDGGKQKITYAIWDTNQQPGMQAIADSFMEKNKDIEVKIELTPWKEYWMKMDAAATGDNLPDVFWMHSNEAYRYMSNDMLLDLTDMIDTSEEVDMSKFPKDIVGLYSQGDKQYAIPKDIDTIGLWYNKTLFDEKNVSYPDSTWTWEDMVEAGEKLTDIEAGVYGIGARKDFQEGYYSFIFQNGGSVLTDDRKQSTFDNPATVEAMDFYVSLSTEKKISPTADIFEETAVSNMFGSGTVAMGFFGSWMVPAFLENEYIVENADVAVLPQGKQRASIYNGLGNAISAGTKSPEAALKFVEYLGSKEAMEIQAENGSAIPAYEGVADKWIEKTSVFNTKAYVEMLDYAEILPYSSHTVAMGDIELDVLTDTFSGKTTAEEAGKEITEKVNELLASE